VHWDRSRKLRNLTTLARLTSSSAPLLLVSNPGEQAFGEPREHSDSIHMTGQSRRISRSLFTSFFLPLSISDIGRPNPVYRWPLVRRGRKSSRAVPSLQTLARPLASLSNFENGILPMDDDNDVDATHSSPLQPPSAPSRQYTSLQEHADCHNHADTPAGDERLTPRFEYRREGFTLESSPSAEHLRRNSRNPLPPDQHRSSSPPPLEEILRQKTIDDADNIQNVQVLHRNTGGSAPAFAPESSVDTLERTDTRRSSITEFAKGLVTRVPDMRMFAFDKPKDGLAASQRRASQDIGGTKPSKKDRKLSFAPLPTMVAK